jgi:hypothetical protein
MFSQTGPGGVGNSSSNILWLKSEDITSLLDGDNISSWSDASGNSNTVSQPNSSFTPVYRTAILNGFPAVRFEKTNGRLRRTGFTSFPTTAITAIYVNKNSESANDATLSYASSSSNNDFLLFSSNNLRVYRGSNVPSGVAFNDNSFHITNASWQSSGGTTEVWKDGSRDFTGSVSSGTTITSGGSLAIAGEQDSVDGSYDAAQAHFGDFTEIIIYNDYLNQAEQIIVANYLAAKYGLTISNDRYAYQGTHENDVAGIGRETISDSHLSATSDNILQIGNASGINANQEYLLFGHDGNGVGSWTTTEAPDSGVNIQRLEREWRLDETGDVGTIDVVIDVATFPTLPVDHTMYALMVDSDGDFSTGASVYELSLDSGTEYSLTGLEILDGDYIALAAVNPKIQHTNTVQSGDENINASIEISLNFIPETDKTVEFTTANGSATSGSDYTAALGTTATILAGNTSANYAISITNDLIQEPTETFTSTLSNPSVGITLGTNSVLTYSIIDNDNTRKVYFDVETDNGIEASTPVTVNVSINVADPTNPTSVDYTVSGGTAIGSGTDFTLTSGTVTFPANVTTGSFSLTIDDDAINENDETIIIELSNPVNCNLDDSMPFAGTGFISYTYTINDDDLEPTMQFTTTSSLGSESTSSVDFEVSLNTISAIDASTNYTVAGVSATSGNDFTLSSGTITIPSGSTTANITANINNDVEVELNETFTITLVSPTSDATLGANTVHTYTITDDDTFGYTGPGGVGDDSTNIFWLNSNEISALSDDDNLVSWSDVSGNTNDFSQSATFSPVYKTNIVNGFPVARFSKTNNRIRKTSFTGFAESATTAIFVNKNNGESGEAHVSYAASAAGGNDFLLFNSSNLQLFVNNSSVATGVSLNDNNWHIINASWRSSDGNYEIWKDGTESATGSHASGATLTDGGTLAIAGEQDFVDGGYVDSQSHTGDYPEVIMYNVYINTAQQIIVSNYLSAKYDISIANDFYTQDDAGDFDFNVAGIGRATDGSFHADSQGNGIVRMLTPSSLNDDDYLFWGRNNQTSYSFSTNTSNYKERITSNWRVSKRNDLGTVTVEVDMTGIDLSSKQSCAPLQLIVDNDADLLSPTTTYTLTNTSGNIYQATGVSFSDGDYFTIEFIDTIVLDGTQFYNGSGIANRPNTSDDCYKLLVKNTATGTLSLSENANVREIEVESGGKLVVDAERGLQVTNGITLNGEIRLLDKAQLIQTHTGTSTITGIGNLYIDRDSEVVSKFLYNYFSSPVVTAGSSNYTVASIMKDGTTPTSVSSSPPDINYITGLDGNFNGSSIEIAERWIYTYDDVGGGTYAYDNNSNSGSTQTIDPGKGFLFKGPGRAQNYTFVGKPNDGTYTYTSIPSGVNILVGNPYPSAFDVQEFLSDNSALGSTIYLWQQAAVDNVAEGHFSAGYNGDYAIINLSTSTAGTLPSEITLTEEAEDGTLGGSAVINGDKVDLITALDEITFDFNTLSIAVDSLFIGYSSNALKTIDVNVNNVSQLTNVNLPSTSGELDTLKVEMEINPLDEVVLKSNDANTSSIDHVFVKQKFTSTAPSFNYFTVGQGFFFFTDNAGTLEFNNSQRAFIPEGTSGSFFFKNGEKKKSDLPVLKLGMDFSPEKNQVFHKQIAISFKKGNSFDYDRGFDSELQEQQQNTDFYWKFRHDDALYGIAGVQEITDDLEVPLEILIENSQEISIGIDVLQNIDKNIFIKDTETDIYYNISNEKAKIQLEAGVYKERFYLVFKESLVLSDNNEVLGSFVIKHNRKEKVVSIHNKGTSSIEKVTVYSLIGQKIIEITDEFQLAKKEILLKTNRLKQSVYVVSIETSKGKITKRFI